MHSHVKSKSRVAQYGEVLTPPEIVNAMLDLVKQETERIDSRFLEPACKSGIFLREIARQLDKLEAKIPDRQARINYILTRQLFGIAITELTGLLSRRSLYCSNTADGKYENLTADTEQIKAFRDTLELSIHSYLTYLRYRLLLARELLTESGSIFAQIGDKQCH